jgi:hypothetical protein
MSHSDSLPIDWSDTNLRKLVDFIGPRLECESEPYHTLLVFHSLNMRQWPGVCVYFKHPISGLHMGQLMLEHDGQCLSILGATFEQIMSSRDQTGPPKEEWGAFYFKVGEYREYCETKAANDPVLYARIQKVLNEFSVEVAALRLTEATRSISSTPVPGSRALRL